MKSSKVKIVLRFVLQRKKSPSASQHQGIEALLCACEHLCVSQFTLCICLQDVS